MATTTLPRSHIRLHLPLHTANPSYPRCCRLLPSSAVSSRLQNPATTTATHYPILPPAPSPSLLAAEEASLAPRRTHRFPGSVAPPRIQDSREDLDVPADDDVLRRALEVRRAVATEALVAALSGGKAGGLTYVNNLTSRMGAFVDRIVVGAPSSTALSSEPPPCGATAPSSRTSPSTRGHGPTSRNRAWSSWSSGSSTTR
ncbi:hypothetical protein VPH35_021003 [Triticum aestivum]